MTVSSEELQKVKQYLRVDTGEDDALIGALMEAAKRYLKNAGVDEPETEDPLYTLALYRLTLFYYDQRSDAEAGSDAKLTPGLNSMILQLRYSAAAGASEG